MRIGITFDYKSAGIKAAQNGLKALAKTALGTSLSIGGAATAISRMVRSAADNQRAFANLGQTMQNLGFVGAEHQARDLFNQLELQHGIVTSELLPAYRTLFNSLGNVQGAQETLNAAIKTSIGSGRNLGDVSSALAKAYLGQTSAISKLNIGLTKAELSSMSFDKILTRLENKFGGAAATNAEQFATKMDRVKLAINQAKDAIGEGFIFAIEESGRRSGRTVDDITNKIVTLGERTSQYIRLISLRWGETSSTIEQSWLGKLLDNIKFNNPTFLGKLFEFGALGLKAFNEEAAKLQDPFANYNPATRADRMTTDQMAMLSFQRTQYIMEQARLREERAKKRTAAAEAARRRAAEAQEKKRRELEKQINEIAKQFDIERISIQAALNRQQDQTTRDRLDALMRLNNLQYMELDTLEKMDDELEKLKEVQDKLTGSATSTAAAVGKIYEAYKLTTDEAKRLADVYSTSMVANKAPTFAAARAADALASAGLALSGGPITPGSGAAPLPTATTPAPAAVTVNINALSTMDIEEAVAAAVNSGSRSGLAYTQLFSRIGPI